MLQDNKAKLLENHKDNQQRQLQRKMAEKKALKERMRKKKKKRQKKNEDGSLNESEQLSKWEDDQDETEKGNAVEAGTSP